MFHPESNPLAPKSTGPKKPEKELVEIWLGKDAAAEMDERESEKGDEDLKVKADLSLTKEERQKLWEMKRPDEVTLRNIPTWKELPDEETFTNEFKLNTIGRTYLKGRPLSYFIPRPEETLPSFQTKEALPHAKVFDIGDVIAKAKGKDPGHPDYLDRLTAAEVLEAIDEAGYRPATLQELVAYARDYWKPDADPKTLTKEERELLHSQAPCIIGLGSVFWAAGGGRCVPYIYWSGAERGLGALIRGDGWDADARFLVLRKAFLS